MTQSQAFEILKTGSNVFLTGEPGSGKTHTINEYTAYLRSHGIEPAITASTGIAATHIGGMTIHSWSGIGIKNRLTKQDLQKIATSSYIKKRIMNTHVLIVEEVSMLPPNTLSMVDEVCRKIKGNSEPFGGVQIIFAGDFFQLPPVVKVEIDENDQATLLENSSARFAYDSPAWKAAQPVICYLTEQHRQDDSNFLSILNSIRKNSFTNISLDYIATRKIEQGQVSNSVPKLFSRNADVDRINDEVLADTPGESQTFDMYSQGPEVIISALKKGCISPETLYLKIGAAVMFTKNNPKEGYVNGTLGIVESFNKKTGWPVVTTRDGRKIEVEPADWTVEENGKIRASITQLPLRLAWAITVHKSQGMSLDEAVVDLSDVFEFGQGYVALSRVRRLSGLYILGWNKRAFQVHPEILVKDEEFRNNSDQSEKEFSEIPGKELQKIQDNFIIRCGGKLQSVDNKNVYSIKEKIDTYNETLELWQEGKNILQIAEIRGLKESTILNHIEKLILDKKISKQDIIRILTPKITEGLQKIHSTFKSLGTEKLSPIFEKLGGEYSYDELRIARILLEKK